VARNRKRAKERRSRRPASSQLSRPGVATARPEREREQHEREQHEREKHELEEREAHERETPSPIEHATPDVELAEAQLEVGRPDLADVNGESPARAADEPEESVVDEPEEELDEQDFEDEEDFADEAMQARGTPDGAVTDARDGDSLSSRRELATSASAAPTQRKLPGSRLFNFLQGSWRELQRVQWPDRRQVMQATGVVIGFVIVAGVYLGVADELAGKIVTFILK
jgi:preprotein translocase subunit SecE